MHWRLMHVRHVNFHFRDKLIDLFNSKVRGNDSYKDRWKLECNYQRSFHMLINVNETLAGC